MALVPAAPGHAVHGAVGAGYELIVPEGTFYVLERSPIEDDAAFVKLLADRGVWVLPGSMFEMPGRFRISLTANDDMVSGRSRGSPRRSRRRDG